MTVFVLRYWKLFAVGGPLLLLLAIQHVRYEGLPLIGGGKIDRIEGERDDWKRASQGWKTAHAKLNSKYQTELAEARAERARAQADYDDAARRADRAEADLDTMRDRAAGYAKRMRITVNQGRPANTAPADPAEDNHGEGGAAEFVAVSRNDFDILVENSLRLEKVWRWGQDLIARKRAEALPEPEFGRK